MTEELRVRCSDAGSIQMQSTPKPPYTILSGHSKATLAKVAQCTTVTSPSVRAVDDNSNYAVHLSRTAQSSLSLTDSLELIRRNYFSTDLMKSRLVPSFDDTDDNKLVPADQVLSSCSTRPTNPLDEKFNVDKATADYLASICRTLQADFQAPDISQPSLRSLRLEEPILATDPEVDVILLRERNHVSVNKAINAVHLGYAEHKGKGMWIPEPVTDVRTSLAQDKYDVDVTTVQYLQDIARYDREDRSGWQDYDVTTNPRFVSYPLMPRFPVHYAESVTLVVNDRSSRHANKSSCSPSTSILEARAVDPLPEILRSDVDMLNGMPREGSEKEPHINKDVSLTDPPTEQESVKHQQRTMSSKAMLDHNTCTSPDIIEAASNGRALRSHWLQADIGKGPRSNSPLAVLNMVNTPVILARTLQNDECMLHKEEPLTRVAIPEIRNAPTKPPWQILEDGSDEVQSSNKTHAELVEIHQRCVNHRTRWAGVSSLEVLLPWSPFPTRFGRVPQEEDPNLAFADAIVKDLELDGSLGNEPFETNYREPLVVSVEANECATLRPIDMPYSTIERQIHPIEREERHRRLQLSTGFLPNSKRSAHLAKIENGPMSMDALLKKRKRELEAVPKTGDNAEPARPTRPRLSTNGGGLSSFMLHQGQSGRSAQMQSLATPKTRQESVPTAVMTQPPEAKSMPTSDQQPPPSIPPAPPILNPDRRYRAVLASALTQDHHFIRTLIALLPKLDFIARDPPASPQLAYHAEADITLSPSAGIVLTNLQALKQKALPGRRTPANSTPNVRTQIASIARWYESLHVLVSSSVPEACFGTCPATTVVVGAAAATAEPSAASTLALPNADVAALSAFRRFCAELTAEADIHVHYVGGSGSCGGGGGDDGGRGSRSGDSRQETGAARWAAALTARHAWVSGPVHSRLEPRSGAIGEDGSENVEGWWSVEESEHERELRLVGMNAFAAQAVLAAVPGGLPEFAAMSARERARRFGSMMGGYKMLARVSAALDGGRQS